MGCHRCGLIDVMLKCLSHGMSQEMSQVVVDWHGLALLRREEGGKLILVFYGAIGLLNRQWGRERRKPSEILGTVGGFQCL